MIARFKSMCGYNVFHPMRLESFWTSLLRTLLLNTAPLPPWTHANIDNMKEQLKTLGISYDWDREVATCKPDYYKFTQWMFLKLYEHNLALI